jgi:acetate kinase
LLASHRPAAKEAIDLFVYRIGRELGSLAAALSGLDAIVFTARWLGVALDGVANNKGSTRISLHASKVSVWVVPTDENLMVARHTHHLLDSGLTAQ